MKRDRESTIESSFKLLCEHYIKTNDHLHYSHLFAPYIDYKIELLKQIVAFDDNLHLIEKARNKIKEIARQRFSVDGEAFYFDYDGISSYLDEDILLEQGMSKNKQKIKLYYLCFVAFIIAVNNLKVSYEDSLTLDIDELDSTKSENRIYYRGHQRYDWRLSPSILRGLDKSIVLDDNSYYAFLDSDGYEDKFNKLIRTNDINTYDKYAFMQHARSFSPLIDFTKDIFIATSFALSNVSSLNEFRNNDSAVVSIHCLPLYNGVITDKREAKRFLKTEFNLTVLNVDSFVFGKEYYVENSDGSQKRICIKSFNEFIEKITPKFKIISVSTNDRMRYQKGVFVCFYDCLCFKSFICYELNSYMHIRKLKIPSKNKRKALKKIYSNRTYDPEHLMNPYLIFNE